VILREAILRSEATKNLAGAGTTEILRLHGVYPEQSEGSRLRNE
jgi:hypothetical protein